MIKILEIITLIFSILLYICTCILGFGFGMEIAIISSAIILISILPIKNQLKLKQVNINNPIYYIYILTIILFTLFFSIKNINELLNINIEESYSIYLTVEVMIGYLLILISNILYFFFKKEKPITSYPNKFLQCFLILIPSIFSLVITKVTHSSNLGLFQEATLIVFEVAFIIGMIYHKNEFSNSKLQALYFFFIILAIMSFNLPALIILFIMYIQLDKISINI